jgi:L-amino acid N-acyltransferase YncA
MVFFARYGFQWLYETSIVSRFKVNGTGIGSQLFPVVIIVNLRTKLSITMV